MTATSQIAMSANELPEVEYSTVATVMAYAVG